MKRLPWFLATAAAVGLLSASAAASHTPTAAGSRVGSQSARLAGFDSAGGAAAAAAAPVADLKIVDFRVTARGGPIADFRPIHPSRFETQRRYVVAAGTTVTISLAVENAGPDASPGAYLFADSSESLGIVDILAGSALDCGSSTRVAVSAVPTCNLGALPVGQRKAFKVTLRVRRPLPAGGGVRLSLRAINVPPPGAQSAVDPNLEHLTVLLFARSDVSRARMSVRFVPEVPGRSVQKFGAIDIIRATPRARVTLTSGSLTEKGRTTAKGSFRSRKFAKRPFRFGAVLTVETSRAGYVGLQYRIRIVPAGARLATCHRILANRTLRHC